MKKETDPDGSSETFTFDPSWSDSNISLSDDGTNTSSGLLPSAYDSTGNYSVSEINLPTGWSLDTDNTGCTDNIDQTNDDPDNIALRPGETVTCTA